MQTQQSRFSRSEASGGCGDGRSRMGAWASSTVEEQPMTTLCCAFAAGFALGAGMVTAYCSAQSRLSSQREDRLSERMVEAISKALPSRLEKMWHR